MHLLEAVIYVNVVLLFFLDFVWESIGSEVDKQASSQNVNFPEGKRIYCTIIFTANVKKIKGGISYVGT